MCENWRVYYPAIIGNYFPWEKGISLLTLKQERNKILDIHINYIFYICWQGMSKRGNKCCQIKLCCPTLPHLSSLVLQPTLPVSMNLVRKRKRSWANSSRFCQSVTCYRWNRLACSKDMSSWKRPSVSPCNMQEDRWPEWITSNQHEV